MEHWHNNVQPSAADVESEKSNKKVDRNTLNSGITSSIFEI